MKKIIRAAGVILTLVLFIGACQPVASSKQQQKVQNTSTLDTKLQINTAVAQTIESQVQIVTSVALITEAQYTTTTTASLFTITTLTPFVFLTPTNIPSGGGSGAPAKAEYACDVIRVRPFAYSEFNRGQDFDIKMTVVNQGTRSWYQGFDLKYTGGAQMTSLTQIELPSMSPGDQYQIILDATAPTERGKHTMTWTVEGQICFGYITITVK